MNLFLRLRSVSGGHAWGTGDMWTNGSGTILRKTEAVGILLVPQLFRPKQPRKSQCAIHAPGKHESTVAGNVDVCDLPRESIVQSQLSPAVDIPKPLCSVVACRECSLSVRRELHASNHVRVALKTAQLPSCFDVPQPNCLVPTRRQKSG